MSLASNPFFQAVRAHAEVMLAHGRDPHPTAPSPLFASVVDPAGPRTCTFQIVPPPGIRLNDLPWAGNNLMHDIPFLETLLALSRLTGERRYADAVDAVFAYYPTHCPHPETGLFPWGEHAQYSFLSHRILANACNDPFVFSEYLVIHDHLRFAPAWFWQRIAAVSPAAVVKYAHGLNFHVMNPATLEHNRHAPLAGRHWNPIPYLGQGKDFARHAGFFIFETLFAWQLSGDTALLDWARRKLQYHLERRLPNGLVRGCARSKGWEHSGQHDQLALCLADAAAMLGRETPVGREMRAAADELFAARAACPELPPDIATQPVEGAWRFGYGGHGSGVPQAANLGQVHAHYPLPAYADAIVAGAAWQARVPPPPTHDPVVCWPLVQQLELQLAAHDLTGEPRYLERAAELGRWALDRWRGGDLFLGVINLEYYSNQNIMWSVGGSVGGKPERPGYYLSGTGTPSLVRSLLRLALRLEGQPDFLGNDPHHR
jgi:hypothetical protein